MAAQYSHQLSPAAVACCLCSREALEIHWDGLRWASGVHTEAYGLSTLSQGLPCIHLFMCCETVAECGHPEGMHACCLRALP